MIKGKSNATKTDVTVAEGDVENLLMVQAAKSQFLMATANMGFRLFVTVVIPIVAGVKLDERFNSAPSLTLAGLFLAAAAGSAAVWSTVKQVNQETADANTETKRGKDAQ